MNETGVADRIFFGGDVITMNDAHPSAEAVAVAGGKIAAVGSKADVMQWKGPATEVSDLNGRTMLPGFLDGHSHFINAVRLASWANVSAPPVGGARTFADLLAILQATKKKLGLKPGDWLMGYGYDITAMDEPRDLTRADLDAQFPDNPVLLMHVSLHGAVLNTAGFKATKFDLNAPTPPQGMTARIEGTTEAAGLVMEHSFLPIFMNMPSPTEQDQLDAMAAAQEIYASNGYTTAHDSPMEPSTRPIYHKAADRGLLYLDLVGYVNWLEFAQIVATRSEAFGAPYKNRFRVAGVKVIGDGSPQGKTAFWTQPLLTPGPGGEKNWRGEPNIAPEDLNKIVKLAYDNDIQFLVHCSGDATIDMVLDAHVAAGAPPGKRTTIIHSHFVRRDQLDKYVEFDFLVSFFTNHTYFWGDVHVENTGKERAYFMSPARSARDRGIRFSNHSDFAVTPLDPMFILWTSVNRISRSGQVIGPGERIAPHDGLRALTIDAAYQYGEEARKGSIETGKLADLTILDANPTTVDAAAIKDIKVSETIKEGKTIYKRDA
jgi:predicted amidohydrolase YtcJ